MAVGSDTTSTTPLLSSLDADRVDADAQLNLAARADAAAALGLLVVVAGLLAAVADEVDVADTTPLRGWLNTMGFEEEEVVNGLADDTAGRDDEAALAEVLVGVAADADGNGLRGCGNTFGDAGTGIVTPLRAAIGTAVKLGDDNDGDVDAGGSGVAPAERGSLTPLLTAPAGTGITGFGN